MHQVINNRLHRSQVSQKYTKNNFILFTLFYYSVLYFFCVSAPCTRLMLQLNSK